METNKNHIALEGAIADLIPTYLANRKREVLELRAALATHNLDRVRYLAHRMRGGGAAYGFPDITLLGRRIENTAHDGQPHQIESLIDEYDGYLRSLSVSLGM